MKTKILNFFFLFIIIPALLLAKRRDDELLAYAQGIIESLTGNANFPTTTPTLADLQDAVDDYSEKLAKAFNGTKADTNAKNDSRIALERLLTALALDVVRQSADDLTKYLTSGFSAKRPATPAGVLPMPQNFTMKAGDNEGEMNVSCQKVENNHGYEFWLGTDPVNPDEWTLKLSSSSSKAVATALTSGTKYYGRCRAIGSRGLLGDWSDITSKRCS